MTTQTFVLPPETADRTRIADNLRAFVMSALPGKRLRVEVSEARKERSSPQCRYLNGVAYKLLGDATGYERDDISEYLCGAYFGWKDKRVPGQRVVQIPIRTTTTDADGKRAVLNKQEFADYVDFVQRFGTKHGVYIPDPNEA
jgi:hypothetical protein